jgi:uncharacterized protein YndB with AHSA1/START domain
MTETTIAVRHALTVKAPPERAFAVFTQRLGTWWPLEPYSIGASKAVDAALEPHPGGRWYEIGEDGSQCDWGHVRAWEPPHPASSSPGSPPPTGSLTGPPGA